VGALGSHIIAERPLPFPLYPSGLLAGTLVRRYARFLADVRLASGDVVTAHCPNSGSMATCCEVGARVLISPATGKGRRLAFTWEQIEVGRKWVGIHSARSNAIVAHFLGAGQIAELRGYTEVLREVRYGEGGRSRVDLVLKQTRAAPCYVEVKHSTMRVGRHAAFPDAKSERARKHLEDLEREARRGARAVIFFAVGRPDCARFRPADEVDPAYGTALRAAAKAGVEVLAYRFAFGPDGAHLRGRLPVDLERKG
jgi:sugar fermentation stimulation protein A